MKNRTTINATGPRHGTRGAALILAIAIMTILLAIALTFYAISRQEVDNADNVKNRVQADLLVDAALAMTIARINEDFAKHPEATSLDHPLFTIFNGSWAVAKDHTLWKPDGVNPLPLQEGGIPLVSMADMPYVEYVDNFGVFQREHLYSGPLSRDWLYYPRVERGANFMYPGMPSATGAFYQGPTGAGIFTNYLNGEPFIPEIFNINNRWGSGNPVAPFVTPAFYGTGYGDVGAPADGVYGMEREGYAIELIDTWTDVDSDGDGKRDAIWIPIGRELITSGGEALLDGTDARLYDDGIDGDLDGMVDENQEDGVDDDLDGNFDDNDEQMEFSSFVYNGASDGRDNDGDGVVDEADENKLFLTTPLPELVIPVDFNADGQVPDYVPNAAGQLEILRIALPPTIAVNTSTGLVVLSAADVDVLDNDYDMLANDYHVYAFVGPNHLGGPPFRLSGFEDTGERYAVNTAPFSAGDPIVRSIEDFTRSNTVTLPTFYDTWVRLGNWATADQTLYQTAIRKSYDDINNDLTFGTPTPLLIAPATGAYWSDAINNNDTIDYTTFLPYIRVTHSGEPVSELVGRAAIHVRDTASQINLNVAGAHTLDPFDGEIRSLGDGTSAGEIETRILPLIGWELAGRMWTQRTGSPDGNPAAWDISAVTDFAADISYPGLGRVDDNGNILSAMLNGKDDDGDGLIDEGLYLPDGSDPFLYARYYDQLGAFEGVDESAELQRYRPLPNLLAEDNNPYDITGYFDGRDNDLDDALNERGEFGDIQLNDTLRVKEVYQIGDAIYEYMHPTVTAFSTDRNANFVTGADGVRAVNKLDYNFASPQEIAANLLLVNSFELSTVDDGLLSAAGMLDNPRRYATGLLEGDVHWRASNDLLMGGAIDAMPAESILQAMQTAVDIVDNRDRGHTRSLLTTERQDRYVPSVATAAAAYDTFPTALGLRERIEDADLFPLEEIEAYLRDAMGVHRKLHLQDDWWTFTAGVTGLNGNPEQRNISYTVSGNEAVRINEIMVRPVRRIEAEAIIPAIPLDPDDPMDIVTNPGNYDPQGGYPQLPAFLVERLQTDLDGNPATDWALNGVGYLGEDTWLQTSTPGEVLQFRIRATPPAAVAGDSPSGLPAGRYYLTVNIRGSVTSLNPADLEYAVKYVNGGTDIITDGAGAVWRTPVANHYADVVPAAPYGTVFLNGTDGDIADDYYTDGGLYDGVLLDTPFGRPNGLEQTFTVTVTENEDTYIAFRLAAGAVGPLAIDSLDFSQEPDHEWLELVNVSDERVNISGWQMEVGIPDSDGAAPDPFKSTWTVPNNSYIAPGGMVLLAFNKFDTFRDGGASNRIFDNGMGLADGNQVDVQVGPLVSDFLTIPTVFDDTSRDFALTSLPFQDFSGSVFYRTDGSEDYVDRDGDGRSSWAWALDLDNTTPDTDALTLERATVSSGDFLGSSGAGAYPWDRIIQLAPNSIVTAVAPYQPIPNRETLDGITDVDDVAAFVLRGGVFPNYPEQDDIDNDGDGGYSEFADLNGDGTLDPIYIAGVLDRDMVDNNGNNYIDERGAAKPEVGINAPDPYGILADFPGDGVDPRQSEGVDEGRRLDYGFLLGKFIPAGFYSEQSIPLQFLNSRGDYPRDVDYFNFTGAPLAPPGDILNYSAAGNAGFIAVDVALTGGLLEIADPLNPGDEYLGSLTDPPDFKAFTERRWYPGDNVVVTLYDGPASNGDVVDRITYREFDVTNRTIDDMAPVPYVPFDDDGSGFIDRDEIPFLNYNDGTDSGYPTFWLPNQMGLDFYRSLERKHPLYNGDRFGTENRWQATDGNYDDWADSPSFFEAILETDAPLSPNPVTLAENTLAGFGQSRLATDPRRQIFEHAMAGSPLRMNLAARKSENPPDLEQIFAAAADPRQFANPLDLFRSHEDDLTGAPTQYNQSWNHQKAVVANRPYQSPGELMRLSHQVYVHDAINTEVSGVGALLAGGVGPFGFLRDMTMINMNIQTDAADYTPQDIALRGATLGQDDFGQAIASANLLRESINSMAIDPMIFTVGQAEFHPIRPELVPGEAQNPNILDWVQVGGDPDILFAPATWAPVFLFELNSDDAALFPRSSLDFLPNYPTYDTGVNLAEFVPRHYLFNGNYLSTNMAGYYNNVYENRWTLEQRTALYVSQNRAGLQQPEALWIWDGEDGLENGEYIVYIGTFLPSMSERVADAAQASAGRFPSQLDGTVAASLIPKVITEFAAANSGNLTTYTTADNVPVVMDRVTASLLRRDPTYDNPAYAEGHEFDPVYAIDIITEPTEARGRAPLAATTATPEQKPPGLIHPDDWLPTTNYRANEDGYIFYGNNAAGGWRPQIVRVTDNFLALRVRNLGSLTEVGAISHIVLAPRKRTAGRINVNTAAARMVPQAGNTNQEYVSALLGLPGVVDVARTVIPTEDNANFVAGPIAPDDAVAIMDINNLEANFPSNDPNQFNNAWGQPAYLYDTAPLATPPGRNIHLDVITPDSDLLVPKTLDTFPLPDSEEHPVGAFRMNALLIGGRTEHASGRFYESVGDLVLDSSAYDYNYFLGRADTPDLTTWTLGVEDSAVYPISNESLPAKRFEETLARFRRMGNLITTRSDVYEIIMTVEAGYGIDRNNDGTINYRDPDEFVTTAATKATAVYERRTPSDQSDGGE